MAFWIAGAAESLSAMAHIVSFGPSLRPCGHPLRRTGPQMASLFPGRMKKAVDVGSSTSRSEEHTSELQSLMRISYAVLCLKKKTNLTMANTVMIIDQHDTIKTIM